MEEKERGEKRGITIGEERGIAIGEERGEERGRLKALNRSVLKLRKRGLDDDEIADFLELTPEDREALLG